MGRRGAAGRMMRVNGTRVNKLEKAALAVHWIISTRQTNKTAILSGTKASAVPLASLSRRQSELSLVKYVCAPIVGQVRFFSSSSSDRAYGTTTIHFSNARHHTGVIVGSPCCAFVALRLLFRWRVSFSHTPVC